MRGCFRIDSRLGHCYTFIQSSTPSLEILHQTTTDRIRKRGTNPWAHFSTGYNPWIICSSDSVVRGMLVVRKYASSLERRLSGRKANLQTENQSGIQVRHQSFLTYRYTVVGGHVRNCRSSIVVRVSQVVHRLGVE